MILHKIFHIIYAHIFTLRKTIATQIKGYNTKVKHIQTLQASFASFWTND